ncbi:HupE/UreJ family protein [Pricia sp. S334]|uniref:HupE/UreJ family protein n=1 Tax=Pricia mediterranea TaxID=3076079 RepID=A0ABU3L0R6_9FLAO|nr:HupE/UreJ family protein [Pricia sp. S334]MDT7827315.1 HupE/UreJ family protein [Pricia sp. S334]
MKKITGQLIFILLFLIPITVFAHRPDRSLIYLRVYETAGIEGRFEIMATDLDRYLGLELGKHPSAGEVAVYRDRIQEYLLEHSGFTSVYGKHKIIFTGEISTLYIDFGSFVAIHFELDNTEKIPDRLEVTYSVFFDQNPLHSNGLGMEYNWKAGLINNEKIIALEFSPKQSTKTLDLTDTSVWKGFVAMVEQGAWHIWIGLDHILFLVALILPSVVRRRKITSASDKLKAITSVSPGWKWVAVQKFKPAFWYIIKIVTFFTIAHSITLSLASLNIVNLPSRWVESIIAFSIGLAAYHNIKPIFISREWVIAFVFGLFHGFGFATVLSELGFKGENLSLSLLGFNIGVELGQIVIIMLIFPVLYLIRKSKRYPKFMVWLSILLIIISLYWFIERVFDIDMPLDEYINGKLLFPIARFLGLV